MKVGIVDYFRLSAWNVAENGAKPNAQHQFCLDSFRSGLCISGSQIADDSDVHGNAVAEIVKDMAPASELFIASVGSVTDLKAAIDWFASKGVTVLTRSLGTAYDGPGDGTGQMDDLVNYAVAKGIVWFNSAGNDGSGAYMKKVVTRTVAVDGGNFVNVNDGSPVVTPAVDTWLRVDSFDTGCFFMDGVRWANDWNLPASQRTDYSVEFWQPKATYSPGDVRSHRNPTVAQVEPINLNLLGFGNQGGAGAGGNIVNRNQRLNATTWPLEAHDIAVCPSRMSNLSDGSFVTYIRIKRNASTPIGTMPDRMEVAIAGPAQFEYQYSDRAGSAAKPVVDSKNPGLVAVGAVDVQTNLRLVPGDSQSIAWYSSQGPTTDGRIKPDVSSWAGVNSVAYGGSFSGTSAAAPTAAGLAALIQGAGLATTPAATAALVKNQSIDRAPLGPDNAYGFGITRLGAAPVRPIVAASPGRFVPLTPTRIYDTRLPMLGVAPYSRAVGSIVPVQINQLTNLVPAGQASAVAVNITTVGPRAIGFVQAFPWYRAVLGSTSTSNLNRAGETVANFAIVPLGDNDIIGLYLPAGGHVVVDLMGWFTKGETATADGRFVPIATPRELYSDTITTGAAASTSVVIDPFVGDPVTAALASAVVVNVTATDSNRDGFMRAAPDGTDPSILETSTVNLSSTGAHVTNMAIVPLGGGKLQVFLPAPRNSLGQILPISVHLKVDLVGYVTSASAPNVAAGLFVPISPTRMFDSREPANSPALSSGTHTVTVGGTPNITGGPGAPANASAYSGNLTVTRPTLDGTFTVFTGTPPPPSTVNVSFAAGQTKANGALFGATSVPGSPTTTTVNAFISTSGHVIIDVNGYFLP